MDYRILTKKEMRDVVERKKSAYRIPCLAHNWINISYKPEVAEILAKYPYDMQIMYFRMPEIFKAPENTPDYRWTNREDPYPENYPLDSKIGIEDWSELDEIIERFPDADYEGLLPDDFVPDGRYLTGHWWELFFERHWKLRGMGNALTDYYLYPNEVHRLFRALTDFYKRAMVRGREKYGLDAIWSSDDLGTQTSTFFSPEIFDEFFAPYYKELIDCAHSNGMHFWLHSCGNISLFLPKFIDMGLDVIHPIQKYAMDTEKTAEEYKGKITFWAGFEVQRTIPYGTPDDVKKEVQSMRNIFSYDKGGFMFTMGNGVNEDCRPELLEAMYEELFRGVEND